jgi:exonuclease III
MSRNLLSFNFASWNVHGLGDTKKCDIIKDTLLNHPFDIILLHETKLSSINQFKSSSFLTSSLQNFTTVDVITMSRGILTAWNSSNLKLLSTLPKTYSISTKFESGISGAIFWITNVYGPNLEEDMPSFFKELKNLRDHIHHPWLITGDFNSVRTPLERSSLHMTINENLFNDHIWDLSL